MEKIYLQLQADLFHQTVRERLEFKCFDLRLNKEERIHSLFEILSCKSKKKHIPIHPKNSTECFFPALLSKMYSLHI